MSTTVDPPGSRADLEGRVTRLEQNMLEVKGSLGQITPLLIRIDATLTATLPTLAREARVAALEAMLTTALPTLATQAELNTKPSHAHLWGAISALLAAIAIGFAAAALLLK